MKPAARCLVGMRHIAVLFKLQYAVAVSPLPVPLLAVQLGHGQVPFVETIQGACHRRLQLLTPIRDLRHQVTEAEAQSVRLYQYVLLYRQTVLVLVELTQQKSAALNAGFQAGMEAV